MDLQTLNIEGHTFALGLMWQTLESPGDPIKEVKANAGKLKQDFYVLRNTAIKQVGYASKDSHAAAGMLSLAAALSKSAQEEGIASNWIGVFKIGDDKFYYIGIRDDVFLPRSDLVGTEEDVKKQVLSDYARGQWDMLYVPASFDIFGSEEKQIADMLPRKDNGKIRVHSWWKIRPVNFKLDARLAAMIGVLIALLVAAYLWWDYQESERIRIENEQKAKILREMKLKNLGDPNLMPKPWLSMADPAVFLSKCLEYALGAPKSLGGWSLGGGEGAAVCTTNSVVLYYSRINASNNDLLEIVPEAQIDAANEKATLQYPLQLPNRSESLHVNAFRHEFVSYFQSRRIKLKTFSLIPYTPPKAAQPGLVETEDVLPLPDWVQYKFAFSSPISPAMLIDPLAAPGVRVDKVVLKTGTKSSLWEVEGYVFVKK